MNNMDLLAHSLEYIENHLSEEIRTEEIARECYCSKSTLEKLFRCVEHITVHDYVVKRRMTKAARMLLKSPDAGILEVALQYGYSTSESFSRAFRQVWNCKPSEFRKNMRISELFPRIRIPLENGDVYMRERRHVDISELYDLFRDRQECWFVCCDIKNLSVINSVSRKAGDMAIVECMKRIGDASGKEDVAFRIGGDEFAILTDSSDREYAEEIARKIHQCDEETFVCEEQQFPLGIHTGIARFDRSPLKYDELFQELHTTIREAASRNRR
ncbi:MAG: helix-turn-helix domain-containing protein [Lachnospiraceae bacterium]|nr:helix-turn-helix domain-containing protein [Lachnospiraceae bacterium]